MAYKQGGGTGTIGGSTGATDNAILRADGTGTITLQNAVPTIDDTGNLSIVAAVSGGNLSTIVSNTSNTASAQAFFQAQVAGGTAADAYIVSNINGGQAWAHGLDNSDSDAFVIASSSTLGTTNVMRVATTGEINFPLQSAFLALNSASDLNVTGDGTAATVNFDSEVFDQNSDFASDTFTAPMTGRYHLSTQVTLSGILSTHTVAACEIVTSNRAYLLDFDAAKIFDNNTTTAVVMTVLGDMDAADTATVRLTVYNGTKVVDILGNAAPWTFFSGNLEC